MKSKRKHIAIVYEGEKTEKALLQNMKEIFFDQHAETIIFSAPACGNIYMIWKELVDNEFEVDVIDIIRGMNEKTKEILREFSARDFSEVYLFFDFDPQNDNLPRIYKDTDVIQDLLETFDNETEHGKLYLSYPMIESFREISSEGERYKTLYVPLDEVKDYKRLVSESLEFQNFKHITKDKWEVACRASVKRAHLIVNYKDEIPTYHYFIHELTQGHIYKAQLEKYVRLNKAVGVLNGVPLFLLEYFDEIFWNNIMLEGLYN